MSKLSLTRTKFNYLPYILSTAQQYGYLLIYYREHKFLVTFDAGNQAQGLVHTRYPPYQSYTPSPT